MKRAYTVLLYLTYLMTLCTACRQEQVIPVEVDFSWNLANENHTSPLTVTLINHTKNADEFYWTFEGGEPEHSTQKNPEPVVFTSPGEHLVTLEAGNTGSRNTKTSVIRVDSAVKLNFFPEVEINNYAPAQFHINNQSSGATVYRWIFEGGNPAAYEGISPPVITYTNKGIYSIILIANNGSSDFLFSRNIEVKDSLDASFAIVPSFEDMDDMEAPLRATFETHLQSVETLLWECEKAEITDKTSPNAELYCSQAGKYTVFLNVSNGKQERRISKEITVKSNTNLRTHKNIRFGINTAQGTIGSVYSTHLRKSFTASEINRSNGPWIDIAFLGLNTSFIYNRFVSPDHISDTPLVPIPGATSTQFINLQERNDFIQLTVQQFESMTTDVYLKNLKITSENSEFDFFAESPLPRVVLFETADGRKGAICIKEAVRNGIENSYILTDIKIQKND